MKRSWFVALGFLTAFPVTVRSEPRYFPLEVGNRWTYSPGRVLSGEREVRVESEENGVFQVRTSGPGTFDLTMRLAEQDGEILIELEGEGLVLYHRFGDESWVHRDAIGCDDKVIVSVVARDEVVDTPAGTFANCLKLVFLQENCSDAGTLTQWWAPEVGLVKSEEDYIFGAVAWVLNEFSQGDPGPDSRFRRGDATADGSVDISDMIYLLAHIYQGGPGPVCEDAEDVNDDGALDVTDAVFGLAYLFLGGSPPPYPGPTDLGYDGNPTDPFTCGDTPPPQGLLPGVSFDLTGVPGAITLAEAEAGVVFTYEVVIEGDLEEVVSLPLDAGGCDQPHASGLRILERISGGRQLYCLCDTGLCPTVTPSTTLGKGRYAGTFEWTGKNWQGPSDTVNPLGEPFPPGRYSFEVRAKGSYPAKEKCDTCRVPFEITASVEFELVP